MIPYGKQNIDQDDIDEVVRVLKSDFLTTGPKVKEFEKALADACGCKYAVAVNNGTSALFIAYKSAGIGPGDEVITTPNTFAATSNMLLQLGARPVFCDIRMDTYNIDERYIENLITNKTKAIVPVHFAGHPAAMEEIRAIAKKYNLFVIEDACQALGSKLNNMSLAAMGGDMSVLSFHPVKSITTGEGGAVLTDNEDMYEALKILRNHGIDKNRDGSNVMVYLGYNHRMSDIHAALGVSQMRKLDAFIRSRHQRAEWYTERLLYVEDIIIPTVLTDVYSAWHIYIIRLKDPSKRHAFREYLQKKEISTNLHHGLVYKHPYYQENGFSDVVLKNAEKYEASAVTLPLYTTLSKDEVAYICETIKKFFMKYKDKEQGDLQTGT